MRALIVAFTLAAAGGAGPGFRNQLGHSRGFHVGGTHGPSTAPSITSFIAASSSVTLGSSTTLTGVFTNGTGSVDQGVGAVTSGVPVTVSPSTTTTYTLTVSGSGSPATSAVTVTVLQPSFSGVDPPLADIWGGALLTLSGSNLSNVSAVTVGGKACTSVTAAASSVTCYSPALDAGTGYAITATVPGDAGISATIEAWHPTVDYPAARVYQSDRVTLWSSDAGYPRIKLTDNNGITARDGEGVIATADGTLVMLGGWSATPQAAWDGGLTTNEVLWSTDNGQTWVTKLADDHAPPDAGASARWRPRHMLNATTHTVAGTTYIYVVGGDTIDPLWPTGAPDVWRSADKGLTWQLMTGSAEWAPRSLGMAWSLNGALYYAGGQTNVSDPGTGKNDVWTSVTGASPWTLVTADAGWPSRSAIISPSVWNGKVWIAGGGLYPSGQQTRCDVWNWDGDAGGAWTQVTADGGFVGSLFNNEVVFGGALWLVHGFATSNISDAWFTWDGTTWYANHFNAGNTDHAGVAVVTPDGGLLVMGGVSAGNPNQAYLFSQYPSYALGVWPDQGNSSHNLSQILFPDNAPWVVTGKADNTGGHVAGPVVFAGDGTNSWYAALDAGPDLHSYGHVVYAVASSNTSKLKDGGYGPGQTITGYLGSNSFNNGPGFGDTTTAGNLVYVNSSSTTLSLGDGGFVDGQMRVVGLEHTAGIVTDVTLWDGTRQLGSGATGGYSLASTGWDNVGAGFNNGTSYDFKGNLGALVTLNVDPQRVSSNFRYKLGQWARKWGSVSPAVDTGADAGLVAPDGCNEAQDAGFLTTTDTWWCTRGSGTPMAGSPITVNTLVGTATANNAQTLCNGADPLCATTGSFLSPGVGDGVSEASVSADRSATQTDGGWIACVDLEYDGGSATEQTLLALCDETSGDKCKFSLTDQAGTLRMYVSTTCAAYAAVGIGQALVGGRNCVCLTWDSWTGTVTSYVNSVTSSTSARATQCGGGAQAKFGIGKFGSGGLSWRRGAINNAFYADMHPVAGAAAVNNYCARMRSWR